MANGERGERYDQVEGLNAVLEALRGPREVEAVYVAKGARREELAGAGVPIFEVEREELNRMSATRSHQGVIARVSPFRYVELDELVGTRGDEPSLLLALDGVEDPMNLGSLLRVADAAGAGGVIIPKRRSTPVTPAVGRASAGAVEHTRIARVTNLPRALERLKSAGLWVVGAEADRGELYHEVDMTGPVVVVLGGEGRGLGRLVREHCDHLASIPMLGRVGSLNVAAAGAVLLFEAVRQRRASGR